jgi:hypothetical protein
MRYFVHELLKHNLDARPSAPDASMAVRGLLSGLVEAAGVDYQPVAITIRGVATAALQRELADIAHDGVLCHINTDLQHTSCPLRFSFGHGGYYWHLVRRNWTYGLLEGVDAVTVWFSRYIGARPPTRRSNLMEWVNVRMVEEG